MRQSKLIYRIMFALTDSETAPQHQNAHLLPLPQILCAPAIGRVTCNGIARHAARENSVV
jgi:hypothetical protein